MTLYKIRDWDKHYENNKSRERERCSFCCVPNKQDGLGYGLLLSEPDGESLYGAFVAVVLIASKQKVRQGYLTANGLPAECPLSARQLSVKCRFKEATIQRMLDVCSSEVDWIEQLESKCPPSAHEVPAECPPSALEGKGRERRERTEQKVSVYDSPLRDKPEIPEWDSEFENLLKLLYRRNPDSRLSHMEQATLAEIMRQRPTYRAEFSVIRTLKDKEPRYFPQSLTRLLSGWQEALDRANNHVPDVKTPKSLLENEVDKMWRKEMNRK